MCTRVDILNGASNNSDEMIQRFGLSRIHREFSGIRMTHSLSCGKNTGLVVFRIRRLTAIGVAPDILSFASRSKFGVVHVAVVVMAPNGRARSIGRRKMHYNIIIILLLFNIVVIVIVIIVVRFIVGSVPIPSNPAIFIGALRIQPHAFESREFVL